MNNKGNQKHLTFEQRVDIEKGLTENKNFAEIGRMIGKAPSTVSKEVRLHAHTKERPEAGYTNSPCIHRKTCKIVCLCSEQCGTLICDVSMYVQATKLLNVKNSRNRLMSVMVVVKRCIVLCQESFIHPSMLMMSIVVSWLIAELESIRHLKAFKL